MKRRFTNPYIQNIRRRLMDVILWQLGHYDDLLPPVKPPEDFSYPQPKLGHNVEEPSLLWINHCTFLIEHKGVAILTDPIWSQRCSPIPLVGPKRRHEPAIELEKLENVDIVLISHNHYDHLDHKTVMRLHKKFPSIRWIVPAGVKKWFSIRGIRNVKELHWWEETLVNLGKGAGPIEIHATPAQHNSGRGFLDFNKSLWMGFVVRFLDGENNSKSFYFVGDTAYNPYDFKKIGERFSSIDLCLCPIGTYKPGRFMRTVHSSPEDAVNIHQDVKASLSVGMHWKTFRLSSEHMEQPPYELFLEMVKRGLNPHRFLAVEPGKKINW